MPTMRRITIAATLAVTVAGDLALLGFRVHVSDDSAVFAGAVARNRGMTLYEGLPHQFFEGGILDRERQTKPVRELGGYPFYDEPLAVADADAARLSAILASPATYQPFEGEKKCGGFHPDYAVVWDTDGGQYVALICLGCSEAKLSGPQFASRNDLAWEAFSTLKSILKDYHKNRPESSFRNR